jgi:L-cysteine S-thiosulfotransferase
MIARLAALALLLMWGTSGAQTGVAAQHSGFALMGPQTQAMQQDDALNPALLWVKEGQALWDGAPGDAERSCQSCHGSPATGMRGVAARYPALDALEQRPVDLPGRINLCRTRHQQAPAWPREGPKLLALQALVALQSRGMPLVAPADPALATFRERGAALFKQRFGQLDLSCSNCHEALAGRRLGSSAIPPADPLPYPVYRLQWQSLGSLQRRIRSCMAGVRAEPFAYGDPELVELELHLAARAAGLAFEAPGVRP